MIPDNSFDEYELVNDIDCKDVEIQPVSLLRTFEGNNYVIKNINIRVSNVGGLFKTLNVTGTIKNLTIRDSIIENRNGTAGVFVGILYGKIIDCHSVNNTVYGFPSGGFVGQNNASIFNCTSFNNSISGSNCGGIAGISSQIISNCTSKFNRITSSISYSNIGGISSYSGIEISNCHSHNNFIENQSYYGMTGGISAQGGAIENCTSYNNHIIGTLNVGGIVGQTSTYRGSISMNNTISGNTNVGGVVGYQYGYSTHSDSVSFNNTIHCTDSVAGGLIGYSDQFTNITNCISLNNNVSGTSKIGGLIGLSQWINMIDCNSSSNVVSGKDQVGGVTGSLGGYISYTISHKNDVKGETSVGGFVGKTGMSSWVSWSTVYNTTVYASQSGAGGFTGTIFYSSSINTSCLIGGKIEGFGMVGGLVGISQGSSIHSSFVREVNVTCLSKTNGQVGGLMGNRLENDYITNSYFAGKTFLGDELGKRPLFGGGSINTPYKNVFGLYWDSTIFPDAEPLIESEEKPLTTKQFLSGDSELFPDWKNYWCIEEGEYPYLSENCPSKKKLH